MALNGSLKWLFPTAISVILGTGGCALTKPPIQESENLASGKTFEVKVPDNSGARATESADVSTILGRLTLPSYNRVTRGDPPDRHKMQWRTSEGQLEVQQASCLLSADGTCNQFSTTRSRIRAQAEVEASENSRALIVSSVQREYYSTRDLITGKPEYEVGLDDFSNFKNHFENSSYAWYTEYNSQFPSDAVRANFKRHCDSFGSKNLDHGTYGMTDVDICDLSLEGREVRILVKSVPYREGTKVSVTAFVPGESEGQVIDFVQPAAQIEEEVQAIVES